MTDRGHTDPATQYVDRLAGYDQRLQMLERSHTHEPQTPVGAIVDWPGPTVPPLWLAADGSVLATADYPDLFNVLGYRYGGSGANFNLPDIRSRVTVGAGGTYALGGTGGAGNVALTAAQNGPHTHGYSGTTGSGGSTHNHVINHGHTASTTGDTPAHTHTVGIGYQAGGTSGSSSLSSTGNATTTSGPSPTHTHPVAVNDFNGSSGNTADVHTHAYSGSTDGGGATGAPHENMPPYLALIKIIKVLPSTAAGLDALTRTEPRARRSMKGTTMSDTTDQPIPEPEPEPERRLPDPTPEPETEPAEDWAREGRRDAPA
jgi:microcystin-dependent protein